MCSPIRALWASRRPGSARRSWHGAGGRRAGSSRGGIRSPAIFATATARRQASEPRSAGGWAAADERELRRLHDDAAQGRGILARGGAVHHHLGDRELALERLAPRLEIDRVGKTILLGAIGVGRGLLGDQRIERPARGMARGIVVDAEIAVERGDARRGVVEIVRRWA